MRCNPHSPILRFGGKTPSLRDVQWKLFHAVSQEPSTSIKSLDLLDNKAIGVRLDHNKDEMGAIDQILRAGGHLRSQAKALIINGQERLSQMVFQKRPLFLLTENGDFIAPAPSLATSNA